MYSVLKAVFIIVSYFLQIQNIIHFNEFGSYSLAVYAAIPGSLYPWQSCPFLIQYHLQILQEIIDLTQHVSLPTVLKYI